MTRRASPEHRSVPTAQQVWHERLRRALALERFSPVAVEFAHDLLALRAHCPEFLRVGGDGRCTWLPNPAAGDDEATERATRERMDRIGEHLDIGPCPRSSGEL
jgi:hypothetical protein